MPDRIVSGGQTGVERAALSAFRNFGRSGMKFTSIGLGTWAMESDPRTAVAALRQGIKEGANHIDTAEMYGAGEVEEIVGDAVKGLRDQVYLVSKVLPSNAGYKGTLKACERSLKHLKTDYLDVYLLHWRENDTPLEETFRAFEKLKEEGKIRAWGVSNFDVNDMEKAVHLVGEGKIICNQVLYHINERAIEFDLIPWCRKHNVAVVAYSPLGQGRLPRNPELDTVAKEHGTTPAQVILAFLTQDPLVFAIPKSSNIKHVQENVRAMNLHLNQEDILRLNKAFLPQRRRTLPML